MFKNVILAFENAMLDQWRSQDLTTGGANPKIPLKTAWSPKLFLIFLCNFPTTGGAMAPLALPLATPLCPSLNPGFEIVITFDRKKIFKNGFLHFAGNYSGFYVNPVTIICKFFLEKFKIESLLFHKNFLKILAPSCRAPSIYPV